MKRVSACRPGREIINVNGHKVSPAPIEDRLREALGVAGVCLFSMQDDLGDKQLHVIVETRAPPPVARLSEALRGEFSAFRRAHVHYTPALPRNGMGKVMRSAAQAQAIGQGTD